MRIIAIITILFIFTFANALFDLSNIQDTQLGPLLKGNWQQLLPSSAQNVK
jgi:hypothetical protein